MLAGANLATGASIPWAAPVIALFFAAQKAFVEVYSLNTNYRDIVNRMKQLEDVRR